MDMNRREGFGRVRGATGALVAVLMLTPLAGGASAQAHRWHQWRTTTGCLFFHREDPTIPYGDRTNPTDYIVKTYTWSGSCTPGRLINGEGVLEMHHPLLEIDTYSGTMTNGYLNGRVVRHGLYNPSRTVRARLFDEIYNMGCLVRYVRPDGTTQPAPERWASCVPGTASGTGGAVRDPAPARTPAPTPAPTPLPSAQDQADADLRALRARAEAGDRAAQTRLGNRYYSGQGVSRDYAEAARWYRRASDQGDYAAQINLGLIHEYGQGVPRDDAEAMRWYQMAVRSNPNSENAATYLRRVQERQQTVSPSASVATAAAAGGGVTRPVERAPSSVEGVNRIHLSESGQPCLTTRRYSRNAGGTNYIERHIVVSNACGFPILISYDYLPQSEGRLDTRSASIAGNSEHDRYCLEHNQDRANPLRPTGCSGVSDPREHFGK